MILGAISRPGIARPVAAALFLSYFVIPIAQVHAASGALPVGVSRDYTTAQRVLRDYARHLQASKGRIDRTRFDVTAKAQALGSTERIFAFVRDSIQFDAYAGALRGARGTLEGRAGNAVDKSLLLAAMLRTTGAADVRIVLGALSRANALKLEAHLFHGRNAIVAPREPVDLASAASGLGQVFGLPEERVVDAVVDQTLTSRTLLSELLDRAGTDAELIRDALEVAGLPLDRPTTDREALLRDITQHAWVVYRGPSGDTHLDPSFPDAAPGVRFADQGTAAPMVREDSLGGTSTIRLLVERLADNKLEYDTLWSRSFATLELGRASIRYSVIPSGLDAERAAARLTAAELQAQLERSEGFQPVFWIDGEPVPGFPFDLKGRKRDVRQGALQPAVDAITSTIEGIFGGRPTPPELTGLRLEIATVPAREFSSAQRLHSRMLLDRLVPGSRAPGTAPRLDPSEANAADVGLRAMVSGEIGITTFVRSREALALDVADQLLASLPTMEMAVAAAFRQPMPQISALKNVPSRPLRTLAWALLSEAGAWGQGYSADYIRAWYSEPRVALYREEIERVAGGTGLVRQYDIVHNAMRTVGNPARPGSAAMARVFAITQGAFETVAEAYLLGGARATNAHNITAAAISQHVPLAVVTPATPADLDRVMASPGAIATLRAQVASGSVVIVPTRAVNFEGAQRTSWWRYDPATGTVLGIGENGEGQAAAEYLTPSRLVTGLLIGIPIGFGACAYFKDAGAERTECMRNTVYSEFINLAALVALVPILGPVFAMITVYAVGVVLLLGGLASGNTLMTDVGMGMVFQIIGHMAFDEVLEPLVGRTLRELVGTVADALDNPAPIRHAIAPALAVADGGAGALRGWPTPSRGIAHEFFAVGRASGRRVMREITGDEAEALISGALRHASSGEHVSRPVNQMLRPLPRMVSVIRGQFNRSGHGVDLFARDAAGNLYIIESKWAVGMFGRAVRLGENIAYANYGTQMGRLWRRVAAQSLAAAPDGPARLRQLYPGLNLSDDALIRHFLADVDRARPVIIVSEDGLVRMTPDFPARSADFDLDWASNVFSYSVRP